MRKLAITVDVEPDLPRYVREGYAGVEKGLPNLLRVLKDAAIPADFFVTASLLPRFAEELTEIVKDRHSVGLHGLTHHLLAGKSYQRQLGELKRAHGLMANHLGVYATMSRAPNFGADEATFQALRALGVETDSSVLPGRVVKKWRFWTVADHRGAPLNAYEIGDVEAAGHRTLLEVPLTANPLAPSTPIGIGFMNRFGVEPTLKALEKTDTKLATFLVHPWECVDLTALYEEIPRSWAPGCQADLSKLECFLREARERYTPTTLREFSCTWRRQYVGGQS